MSDEGAVGLKQILDALTYDVSGISFGEKGSASFSLGDAAVKLTLSEAGTPESLSVVAGGYRRDAEIKDFVMKG